MSIVYAYPRKLLKNSFVNPEQQPDLFEGDIVLPTGTRGVGEKPAAARWTNGIVPYTIAATYTPAQQSIIVAAMRKLEKSVAINNKLCVQFRPKTATDKYFISIVNGAGCSSSVGQNWRGQLQLTLQQPACVHEGTIMHELLHTLGFWHEQSRPDRDSYVTVNYANIQAGLDHAFNRYTTSVDTLGTPYDYGSLMHYDGFAFSANGKATMVPKDPTAKIGQRSMLSQIDIKEVQLYYKCT